VKLDKKFVRNQQKLRANPAITKIKSSILFAPCSGRLVAWAWLWAGFGSAAQYVCLSVSCISYRKPFVLLLEWVLWATSRACAGIHTSMRMLHWLHCILFPAQKWMGGGDHGISGPVYMHSFRLLCDCKLRSGLDCVPLPVFTQLLY